MGNPFTRSPKLEPKRKGPPLNLVQEYCKFRAYRYMRMDGVPSSAPEPHRIMLLYI